VTFRARGYLLLLLAALGCGQPVVREPQQNAARGPSEITSEARPGPLRMTHAYLAALRSTAPAPLRIPLDTAWRALDGAGLAMGKRGLRLAGGRQPARMVRDIAVDANHYSVLRVRMRLDKGTRCTLQWASDIEPILGQTPGASAWVFDDDFHTYTIPLNTLERETWAGRVRRIAFQPSDEPANAEIAWFEFASPPPEGPKRITIAHQTHEALFGTQPPWVLTVPPEATFEVYLGMLERAWEGEAMGQVRFHAVLDAKSDQRVVLVDETLTPKSDESHRQWIRVEADLSAFANKRARITLGVDNLGSHAGDYAYWGNPMVFSRRVSDAIPVILLSWDTVRADHLSCYGYGRETTPHLDQWVKETVLFEKVFTEETWTPTAHATMLTGLYPKNHGLSPNANLSEEIVMLAEVLGAHGYLTGGFVGFKWWLLPWWGFSHGFDVYSGPLLTVRDVFTTQELVYQWLDAHPTPNLFLFFHNFDAHAKPQLQFSGPPYDPVNPDYYHFSKAFDPAPTFERPDENTPCADAFLLAANKGKYTLTDEEAAYCAALYDDCIRMIDQATFELFERLKKMGLYDRALIILTADHGEELGERDKFGHGSVYEECAHIPLIIKFPRGRFAGQHCADIVQLSDIYPTVLDVIGLPVGDQPDGQSLLALLEGRVQPHDFAYMRRLRFRAVRSHSWKLIHEAWNYKYALYDIAKDPLEQYSLYEKAPPVLPRLRKAFDAFFKPRKTGWNLAYRSGDQEVHGKLVLTTEDKFRSGSLAIGDKTDLKNMEYSNRHIEVDLDAIKYGDVLTVTTASPDAWVFLTACDVELTVFRGAGSGELIKDYRVMLDPEDTTYAQALPHIPETVAGPTLFIWYVPPKYGGSAAPDLSAEALESLRALGYMVGED